MGKFMNAKFASNCAQTKEKINKGDLIYYIPGKGAFCKNSNVYQEHKSDTDAANHVKANEDAYYDNFYAKNYGNNKF